MIKNILFDFDGVILDSNPVRSTGFQMIFKDFDPSKVAQLLQFHEANGGLSRYVKIRYFFEQLLGEQITDDQVMVYANQFSKIMHAELTNKALLIQDTVRFLEQEHTNFNMHIVSGSDQTELRILCKELKLSPYFASIHGSPTPKTKLITDLLATHAYAKDETIMIGDAINDYDAANANGIRFLGYNNPALEPLSSPYIYQFSDWTVNN